MDHNGRNHRSNASTGNKNHINLLCYTAPAILCLKHKPIVLNSLAGHRKTFAWVVWYIQFKSQFQLNRDNWKYIVSVLIYSASKDIEFLFLKSYKLILEKYTSSMKINWSPRIWYLYRKIDYCLNSSYMFITCYKKAYFYDVLLLREFKSRI